MVISPVLPTSRSRPPFGFPIPHTVISKIVLQGLHYRNSLYRHNSTLYIRRSPEPSSARGLVTNPDIVRISPSLCPPFIPVAHGLDYNNIAIQDRYGIKSGQTSPLSFKPSSIETSCVLILEGLAYPEPIRFGLHIWRDLQSCLDLSHFPGSRRHPWPVDRRRTSPIYAQCELLAHAPSRSRNRMDAPSSVFASSRVILVLQDMSNLRHPSAQNSGSWKQIKPNSDSFNDVPTTSSHLASLITRHYSVRYLGLRELLHTKQYLRPLSQIPDHMPYRDAYAIAVGLARYVQPRGPGVKISPPSPRIALRGWFDLPPSLQERILGTISLVYLSIFGMTSTAVWALVKLHARKRVTECLESFDLPVGRFLELMRRRKAIISGSAALRIVEPIDFKPGDLDVYVPRGDFDAVDRFLTANTGYHAMSIGEREDDSPDSAHLSSRLRAYSRGIAKTGEWFRLLMAFVHTQSFGGIVKIQYYVNPVTGKTLNIMEAQLRTSTSAVFMFHSTFVMNFITWNTIVCPYPLMTAEHYGLLNSCRLELSDVVVRCLDKYAGRGFFALNHGAEWRRQHDCGEGNYCGKTFRRVSDNGTMRLFYGEDSADAMDVIDAGLRWKLATRVECTLEEEEYEYSPSSGLVVTSTNCTLGEQRAAL
ncbi:hypothetical protein NMY22_g15813 [Coprinellus aureogranulatus]|nr:hypothetical protein NMY22_g15813 [Coprinellus aureogranulatus]